MTLGPLGQGLQDVSADVGGAVLAAEQDPDQVPILLREPEKLLRARAYRVLEGRAGTLRGLLEPLPEPTDRLERDLAEDVVLVPEVEIEGSCGDPGVAGDVVTGDGVEPLGREQVGGRLDQAFSRRHAGPCRGAAAVRTDNHVSR